MGFIELVLKENFLLRSLLVAIFIALASSQIGVFLVARKMSLIGDSLAHISLGALGIGFLLGVSPFIFAFPFVSLLAIFMFSINQSVRFYSDTILGVMSVIGIAIAILLSDVGEVTGFDLHNFLFGNIYLLSVNETLLAIIASSLVFIFMRIFHHELLRLTLDKNFALTKGLKFNVVNGIFLFMTSFAVLLTIQLIGALLVSALLILPAAIALQVSNSFFQTKLISALIAVSSVTIGIFLSYYFDLPTGALVVLINGVLFLIVISFKKRSFND